MITDEQLGIWGKKVARKHRRNTIQRQRLMRFLDAIKWRVEHNMDVVVAVCGPRGIGKSSFAIVCALILRDMGLDFSMDDVLFGPEALERAIPLMATTRRRVYVFDEMIDLAYSRNAMTALNRGITQFMTKLRKMNNVVFLNIPRFKTLDTGFRNDIVHVWIEVFWRSHAKSESERIALAAMFLKNIDPKTDDPWGLVERGKQRPVFTIEKKLRAIRRMGGFKGTMAFHPLPHVIEEEYEARSRSYIGDAGEDFLKTIRRGARKHAEQDAKMEQPSSK